MKKIIAAVALFATALFPASANAVWDGHAKAVAFLQDEINGVDFDVTLTDRKIEECFGEVAHEATLILYTEEGAHTVRGCWRTYRNSEILFAADVGQPNAMLLRFKSYEFKWF